MELVKQIDQNRYGLAFAQSYWTYNFRSLKKIQVLNGDLHTASRQKMWSWSFDVEFWDRKISLISEGSCRFCFEASS